jgi:TPR repeat protein
MMNVIKYPIAALLFTTSSVWAGDMEDGDAAYLNNDRAAALESYKKAAANNDVTAQNKIGDLYFYGAYGIKQDFAEAMYWYTLATKQGLALAQTNLGDALQTGIGATRDRPNAVRWYKAAAA